VKPLKLDAGKPRMDLVPPRAMLEVGKVLAFGAQKYSAHGWRQSAAEWGRYLAAIERHRLAFLAGEDLDAETGLPHLAHLICSALFVLEYQLTLTGVDDRFEAGS
jgi:hypothetical protein